MTIAVINRGDVMTVDDIESAWDIAIEMVGQNPDYAITIADYQTGEVLTQVYLSEPMPEPVWGVL